MIDVAAERRRSLERQGLLPPENAVSTPTKRCQNCDGAIPPERARHPHTKYCSNRCCQTYLNRTTGAERQRRLRARRRGEMPTAAEDREQRNRYIFALREDGKTYEQIAEIVGLHLGTVYAVCTGRWTTDTHQNLSIVVEREQLERWRLVAGDMRFGDWVRMVVDDFTDRRLRR